MIKLFGGGSPLGDGPIETANLARLGLITMNGVNLGRPRAVHCCVQSATRCRSKNGEIKGSFRRISGLKGPWAGCAIDLTGGVGARLHTRRISPARRVVHPAPEGVESGLTTPY